MSDAPPSAALRLSLLAVSMLPIMAGTALIAALPLIEAHFRGAPQAEMLVKMVVALPALFIALCGPLAGIIVDRWGRKPLLLGSVVLYGIAGLSGFFLEALPALLAGRAALGAAVAGTMTATTTLVADYFDQDARHRFMGHQGAWINFGGVAFLMAGGALAGLSWRHPFLLYLLAFVILVPLARFVQEPARPARPDRTAATEGRLPLGTTTAIYGLNFLSMALFFLLPLFLPFFLQSLGITRPLAASAALSCNTLVSAVVALAFPRIRANWDHRQIAVGTLAVLGLGFIGIGGASSYGLILLNLVLVGLAMGLMIPNLATWLMAVAPPHLRGRAIGGLTTSMYLGQFASPLLAQPLVAHAGLATTYLVAAGVFGLTALAAALVGRQPKRS